MKISLNWLNGYIETGLSAEQIAELLSDLGLPCEGIEHLDGDAVIDIEVTSNRGDCLSHIGIARELAAATGKKLKLPTVELAELDKDTAQLASVEIAEPDLCPRYTARVIQGVKVGPSPDWMVKLLEAVGLRSVNNVVDATNYAMMETGQPPHAFDYDKITDAKIIVRKAKDGERLVSIDGTKCDLNSRMLIIADPKGPVAIAGVMGGLETEVSETTKNILLEDAYFEPISVRTTARRLALPSESSFRFERIVDIESIDWASKRTAQLITQVAGGKVAKGVVDIYHKKSEPKRVALRLNRLKALLGIEIPQDEVLRILSALSFQPKLETDTVVCAVPSWRSDIYREIDLIEEIIRVHGYDKIPIEPRIQIVVTPPDERQKLIQSLTTFLNGCGFFETVNVSFINNSIASLFVDSGSVEHLSVKDETRKGANLLRRTLLPSLFNALKTNLNAGNIACRLCEIADVYFPEGKNVLPTEKTKLALVCDCEFRELKGVVESLVRSISTNIQIVFKPANITWAQSGAEIFADDAKIGIAGVVSDAVKQKYDFKQISPCGAELDFQALAALQTGPVKVKPIPRFPAIQRDLSLIVDESVTWADIDSAVNKKAPDKLEDVKFVGIYRGRGIPTGKKSVTLSLTFRDTDGTLTHDTVDAFENNIVAGLSSSVGAELRTA